MEQIQDPRLLQQSNFPIHIVLSQQATSFIAWAINWKTKGNFDHIMLSLNPGKFIVQDFSGYKEIPIDGYLKKGGTLKFVRLTNANAHFDAMFRISVNNRLNLPWYRKLYDWGNILGRTIGLNWLHLPGTEDCSEDDLTHLKEASPYLPAADQTVINGISDRASPDDIDMCIKNNPSVFTVLGEWSADTGVVV